jgi:hypothetical protein
MDSILHDLIVSTSGPFAFIILCFCGVIVVVLVSALTFRPNKLAHMERMAELELGHRERMLKIEREVPKLISNDKNRMIDN